MTGLARQQVVDLVVGRKAAGLGPGVLQGAIHDDIELPGAAHTQFDIRGAELLEMVPHTEGLRLVPSGAAVFDQDFHGMKVGP